MLRLNETDRVQFKELIKAWALPLLGTRVLKEKDMDELIEAMHDIYGDALREIVIKFKEASSKDEL